MVDRGQIQPLRASLNLSDLSDEEVDKRISIQMSKQWDSNLSRNSSNTSGQKIRKQNEGKIRMIWLGFRRAKLKNRKKSKF